jgi:hypothetical protein
MSDCPPRKPLIKLQPNVDFDSEEEMRNHLKVFYPNMRRIIKSWTVKVIRCEIEIPEPRKHE